MAADIQALKRIYRLQARIKAGSQLGDQKIWLETAFDAAATDAADGSPELTSTGYNGQSASTQFRGSNAEERAQALMLAIEDITVEIAAAVAGEDPPAPVGALLPRVVCAPR